MNKKWEDILIGGALIIIAMGVVSWLFFEQIAPLFIIAELALRFISVLVVIAISAATYGFFKGMVYDTKIKQIELVNLATFSQVLNQGQTLITNRGDVVEYGGNYQPVVKGGGLLDTRYNQFYVIPQVSKSLPPQVEPDNPTDPISQIKRGDWLEPFVLNAKQEPNFSHLQLCGPTGKGKTTLALAVVSLLQKPLTQAEYYLSDPKWEGPFSGWPFQPQCIEFDDAPGFAEFLYRDVYTPRKQSVRQGKRPAYPAFGLLDEVDGCFSEHNGTFIGPVKRVLKEGRHTKTHAILIGQSPLAKDCGLNTADMRQCARIVLDIEGFNYLTSSAFPYRSDKEGKDIWIMQLKWLLENNKRGALVIPSNGSPFIAEVPHIDAQTLNFENLARSDATDMIKKRKPTNPKEQKLIEMAEAGESGRAMARFWYDTEKVGGKQVSTVKGVLREFGITV